MEVLRYMFKQQWHTTTLALCLQFCVHSVIQALEFNHSKALTNVSCIGTERAALLKSKQDLTNPLRRLKSWIGESCCEWEGVQCNKKTGHVSKLNLHNPCNGLVKCNLGGYGHISNQLSNLSSLRYLNLSGWIWEEPSLAIENLRWLSTFSYLKYLDLSYVPFLNPNQGWLSPISMLSSLEFLILRGCDLEDVSTSLFVNFTSLIFLDLSQNSMSSSIPPWFQNFSKLKHLDLSDNDLQGRFPTVILENSQWLRVLDVSSNRMEDELLTNSSIFCNLQVLNLNSNKFSGMIFDTKDGALNCGRSNLKTIDVYNNSFSGHLPNRFGNFKYLKFLDLSRNLISASIPAIVGKLLSLRILNLSFNKLSGNIRENIGLLSNLEVMDIGNNQLDGIVNQLHFANLTSLTTLNIYSNGLVINVSASWVSPFQIQKIVMSSCKVGPEFPNWLRTQKRVSILDMSNASILDDVPYWPSDVLSSIEQLDLLGNMLRGNISRIIGKMMPQLTQVSLSRNNLSGEIPNSLCMLDRLSFLDLSSNQLFGRLPQCWRKSQAFLEWISLGANKLNGQIPRSLCHLEQLKVLSLHENGLNGVLPKCLLKLDLVILDLSDNQFTGRIPLFGNPRSFAMINLGRNYFTGDIPLQLYHLANLRYLSLKHNNLSRGIPHCFNNFSRMWENSTLYFRSMWTFPIIVDMKGTSREFTSTLPYLFSVDLSSKALDGQIPKGLMRLARLQNLNLSQNKFVGKIPLDIGKLKDLESLDLSNNKLSGEIPRSISNLNFLSHLNLSSNNLSSPIPWGNQLSTLDDQSIYCGNDRLCGPPLLKACPRHDLDGMGRRDYNNSSENESNEGDYIIGWFYFGLGEGSSVAFLGFCGILHFKQSWRISYFRVVDRIIRKLLIARIFAMLWFKRTSQFQLRQ